MNDSNMGPLPAQAGGCNYGGQCFRRLAAFACMALVVVVSNVGGYAVEHSAAISVVPSESGAIYVLGDKVSFTIKPNAAATSLANHKLKLAVADIAGNVVERLPEVELSSANGFSAVIAPKPLGAGYYTIDTLQETAGGVISNQVALSFGIIPDVRLKSPAPGSPFGVSTHYMRWHRNELPALQAKLGISWFREELNYKRSAEKAEVSPLLLLAEKNNLTWLPLIDYVDANRGVERDGVWTWDDDMAKLKRCFELHKGRLHVYESQNEPNNFGNWTKRFKGPAHAWLADNWGKPFCDLVKSMKTTLGSVDPGAKLLWPDLDSPAWINSFASNWGASPFIDGVAPHPYSLHGQLPEEQQYVLGASNYLAMLDSFHIPRNVWVTELGYTTYKNPVYGKGTIGYHPLTEQQQAAWLVRAYLSHLGWGVSHLFWYDLMEDGNDDRECEHRFGLLRHGSLTPKPAAVAYANLTFQAQAYHWIAPCQLADGSQSCAFVLSAGQTGTAVVVAWVMHGTTEFQLPAGAEVVDIFGSKVVPNNGKVTLSESPVYIHGMSIDRLNLGHRVQLGSK